MAKYFDTIYSLKAQHLFVFNTGSNFVANQKIYFPENVFLQSKTILQIRFDFTGQQGQDMGTLNLLDDKNDFILTDYPLMNLYNATIAGTSLKKNYMYLKNINFAKSFLRFYDPTFLSTGENYGFTVYFRD